MATSCATESQTKKRKKLPDSIVELIDLAVCSFAGATGLTSKDKVRGSPVVKGVCVMFFKMLKIANPSTRKDFDETFNGCTVEKPGKLENLIDSRLKRAKAKTLITEGGDVPSILVEKAQRYDETRDRVLTRKYNRCWRCQKRCQFCSSKEMDKNIVPFRSESLSKHLDKLLRKRQKANSKPYTRRSAESHHRIDILSPRSKDKRLQNIRRERKQYKKIAAKYWEKSKIQLNEQENAELSKLVNAIDSSESGVNELNRIFEEAEKSGNDRGKTLKQVWKMDRVKFLEDQRKNATGQKGNKWSSATFRLAIAVYARSPSAYTALRNLGILQLPCEKQVDKMMKSNQSMPGFNEESLAKEVTKYQNFMKDMTVKNRPHPLGFGALIFDETKVQSKILFDMNSGNVKGFAI